MFDISLQSFSISIPKQNVQNLKRALNHFMTIRYIFIMCLTLSIASSIISFHNGWIIAYGDAESHLNIAKRVVNGLTPGFAQLGGIWLPLPHLMLLPFVYFDFLWRTGLAGSIVSGFSFIVASIMLYKLALLILKSRAAAFIAFFLFATNPNILYMQSTPMTELPLIMFFLLSIYFFAKYLYKQQILPSLILTAFFSFLAVLTRYDGWFLAVIQAAIIILQWFTEYIKTKRFDSSYEAYLVIFSTFSFFGIFLWLLWDFLILGNPLYFSQSEYSAGAQQKQWAIKGYLLTQHHPLLSSFYYAADSFLNFGLLLSLVAVFGITYFIIKRKNRESLFLILLLFVPFLFYVVSLTLGQAVIFIPGITPKNFEWDLFNVRYGIMMVPSLAFFCGYLFTTVRPTLKVILAFLIFLQMFLYPLGLAQAITLEDGVKGLSSAKTPDAQIWMSKHYDNGDVLLDDYARSMSIAKTGIPMQNVIYVGTKPYWNESLKQPEKYAKWIIVQKNDAVWTGIYSNSQKRGELYKYFNKAYTSKDTIIFKRQ